MGSCAAGGAGIPESSRYVKTGGWDSIHVTEASRKGGKWTFKLSTSIIINLGVEGVDTGVVNLSGTLSHQVRDVEILITGNWNSELGVAVGVASRVVK